MRHEGKSFAHATVVLDGNEYLNCHFRECEIVFSAILPVSLVGCQFDGCVWRFAGPASLAIEFMSGMYNGIGEAQQLIERTFENIRAGGTVLEGENQAQVSYKPTVFIGHGNSLDYVQLSDFLRGRGYEVETFESSPRAGKTTKEVVEGMAMRAAIAFLVHTAEDEQGDGALRARQNVVHETGLFQGRLGFERAIVVREEGCDPFTNLDGVQEIRYAKGQLSSKYLEVLDVLNREFPQPSVTK